MTMNGSFLKLFAFRLFALLIIGSAFASCKTSDTLADQGIIQKRKYQKGYHVNVKTPFQFKKDTLNQSDREDRPFTASVKAEVISKSQGAELQYPKIDAPELIVKRNTPPPKSIFIAEVPFADDQLEASKSAAPLVKSKSLYPKGIWSKESVKQSNTFSFDPDYYSDVRRVNTLALLSFIFAIVSLFILGLPLGVAAVVCGIIGLVQIENNPAVYKGKGFAIVGLVIGIIAAVVVLAYIASL